MTKRCYKCCKSLPETDFYLFKRKTKSMAVRQSICKNCHKEYTKLRGRIEGTYAFFYKRFARKRRNAKKNGHLFDLTLEDFKSILAHNKCHYCRRLCEIKTVDRRDNLVGYTLENCVLSCYDCNIIKSNTLNEEEMKIVGRAIRMYKNRTSKNRIRLGKIS